jgi:hypothetical protein
MFVHEFDEFLSTNREVVVRSEVWIADDRSVSCVDRCSFSRAWSSLLANVVVRQFVGVSVLVVLLCCVICVRVLEGN